MRADWAVQVSVVAVSSADGHGDEVEGRSQPDEPEYQVRVRRIGPFGLRGRPPPGVDAVVVCPNASPSSGVLVGAESARYGPADLDSGETALYNETTGVVVRLWKSGKITVDAAAGADVVVNGGTKGVARVDDPTRLQAAYAANGAGAVTGMTLSGVDSVTGVPVSINLVATGSGQPGGGVVNLAGSIVAGAARFKA